MKLYIVVWLYPSTPGIQKRTFSEKDMQVYVYDQRINLYVEIFRY